MKASLSHIVDPLARFTALYQELARGEPWWADNGWLRFAAQAAVLRPADPADTARRIRDLASALRDKVHWYDVLASPWGLITAATLVQHGDSADAFSGFLAGLQDLLQSEGFRLHGPALIKVALVLRVLLEGKPATPVIVERIRRLAQQMRDHHWWLSGKEDAPVCALLAQLPGTPEEIAGTAEGVYATLCGRGFLAGNHLRTAANLLTLSGKTASDAAGRFCGLCDVERMRDMPLWNDHYDALALLSLLDHDAEHIVSFLGKTGAALDALAPVQSAPINFNIAADLVFLDLVRFDAKLRPLIEPADLDRLHRSIRFQRAATLVLVQVPPPVVMMNGPPWPVGVGLL